MIVPSIDLMGGHAVQLVGGKTLEIKSPPTYYRAPPA